MKLQSCLIAAVLLPSIALSQASTSQQPSIQNETVVIAPPNTGNTTVEIRKDGLYVNEEMVASRTDLVNGNLTKKIIIDKRLSGPGGMSHDITSGRAVLGVLTRPDQKAIGALVADVSEGSAAEAAGVRKGDLITRVGSTPISTAEDLIETIRTYEPGDKVRLVIWRDNKDLELTASLGSIRQETFEGAWPGGKDKTPFSFQFPELRPFSFQEKGLKDGRPRLGMTVEDLDEGDGVKVRDVRDGMVADKSGIEAGDILKSVNGSPIASASELQEITEEAKAGSLLKFELMRAGKILSKDLRIPRAKSVREL